MRPAFLLAIAIANLLPAQTVDSSANALLNGDYFFRHVLFSNASTTGTVGRARALTGVITFDGKGGYTITGQLTDSKGSGTQPTNFTGKGQYTVGANGVAEFDNPLDSTDTLYGAVGVSAVVGSSTEGDNHDMFVAVPSGTATVTNSAINGSYRAASFDMIGADVTKARSAQFSFTANGQGSIANFSVAGNAVNVTGTAGTTQNVSGATYTMAGKGTGTLTIPAGSAATDQLLVSGSKTLYASADGSTLIGGNPTGYDLLVAFKNPTAPATNALHTGTYFMTGMTVLPLQDGTTDLFNVFGSSNAGTGNGTAIWHQRTNDVGYFPYDYTGDFPYSLKPDATDVQDYTRFALSDAGRMFVVTGNSDQFELVFGVQARPMTGTGVFLNPLGVVNSANFAPITNPIAPGEFITLFGSGLAAATAQATSIPYPTTLGSVQVTINNRPAPVYLVSPTQINTMVPFATTEPYATVQVTNNGTKSNTVTLYTNVSAPGVFTLSSNGLGSGAILHQDFSVVNASNPARKGETISVFVTGLGAVSPAVNDGAPASGNPLSTARTDVSVAIEGSDATVTFAGLAPGIPNLYQINCVVPSDVDPGPQYIDIETPDAYNSQAIIVISQ